MPPASASETFIFLTQRTTVGLAGSAFHKPNMRHSSTTIFTAAILAVISNPWKQGRSFASARRNFVDDPGRESSVTISWE
jgi:hypothetical protein